MLARRWNQIKGKVQILSETTDEPLTLSGYAAGACWGADTNDHEKNFKRGIECYRSGHWRALEYPQIYMILDGWSAKCIREFYTHIISVTRLQASTRYIQYGDFEFTTPKSIADNEAAEKIYLDTMENIQESIKKLEELGIPKEDASGLLPLNYNTKVVVRIGLRELINMCEQRLCTRAYHEYRDLMHEIIDALKIYSDEWYWLIEEEHMLIPKCQRLGYCNEKYSCGRYPKKEEVISVKECEAL